MSMKITKLTTYWNAGDAGTVIDLLDMLRDALWETYGDQIIEMHREASNDPVHNPTTRESDLDDDIDF